MSTIRRQSIISSLFVYTGTALGAANTLLFARILSTGQYGLTGMFVSIGNIIYAFANLGMPSFINKFYPYYKDNLPREKNDMISLALSLVLLAFLPLIAA